MRSLGSVILICACFGGMGASECVAGDNAQAAIELSGATVHGDTVSFGVLVTSAVETRVVHLMFQIPDGLEFLSWEDGDFIPEPLRIGPEFHEPTRRLLVALAIRGRSVVTESSGELGTARFLRTGVGETGVALVEGCLADGEHREDWIVTPGRPVWPAPPVREQVPVPASFALRSASPNPMVRSTTVSFEIPRPGGHVKIRIYDVRGREVCTLADEQKAPGYYSEVWDLSNDRGRRVAPGIYFCRMEAGEFKDTKKVVLLH